ncbi:MAG TPA: hypothetical protein VNX26_17220 [Candidatus Acidoferrum sp.]|nr:hypothetical protein [Candidatus Acidoferrum sp.]
MELWIGRAVPRLAGAFDSAHGQACEGARPHTVTFVIIESEDSVSQYLRRKAGLSADRTAMDVQTPNTTRRSTRIRVEIPVSVISLDRKRPFAEKCVVLIVSAQGCGFRSSRALQVETPIMLSDLPGGGSVTARVANCLPLGNDGQYFLIGASLYTQGNVWGIANAPADWSVAGQGGPTPRPADQAVADSAKPTGEQLSANKKVWPYNLFPDGAESHPGRK